MKKFIILLVLLACTLTCCANPDSDHFVREIYYAVDNDTVNHNRIIENRFLTYNKDWKLLSGYELVNGHKESLSSDATEYYHLPLISSVADKAEKDSSNRIVSYQTHSGNERILHICKYDQWNNLTEDKSVDVKNPSKIVEVLTYEYYYLTYFKYNEMKTGKLEIKSINTTPWLLRTTRKNGHIVESIERKITETNYSQIK